MRIQAPGSLIGTLGALAQAIIGGANALVTTERGFTYGAAFSSTSNLAAGANEVALAPASNTNGVIVWDVEIFSFLATGTAQVALLAKSSAPASMTDSDVLLQFSWSAITAAGVPAQHVQNKRAVFVAAGKGLYFRSGASGAETVAYRKILYTVL